LTKDSLPFIKRILLTPEELSKDIIYTDDIDGVTISGGEPFLQARNLLRLIELVRSQKNLGFILYSGYTLAELRKMNNHVNRLLESIDVLIDGEYIEELNDDKGLRGSSNQNVIFLSNRYKGMSDRFNNAIREIDVRKRMIIGIKPKGLQDFIGAMIGSKAMNS